MITRRCSERRFFLQPGSLVFQVFVYALALAALATGAQLHAVIVMGNHYHLVVTDTRGNLPDFYHRLHLLVSKCLNTSRGRWENMWSSEETNRVSLEDLDALIDKVVKNPSEVTQEKPVRGYPRKNPSEVTHDLPPNRRECPAGRTRSIEGQRNRLAVDMAV